MSRFHIIFCFALSLLAAKDLHAAESHRAVRAALIDFVVDDNSYRSAQKAVNFTALLQAKLSEQSKIEWVERAQLKVARNELGLSASFGLDDKRSAVRCGKWTKADWLITGTFSRDDQSRRILSVEILDLQHADVIGNREIPLADDKSKTAFNEKEADFVAKQLREVLAEAEMHSRKAEGQIALAPLFFFELNNRDFEPDVVGPEFFRLLDRMIATNKSVRLTRFSKATRAQEEMEMVLSGFAEDDDDAWQKLADFYLWGTCGVTNDLNARETSEFWIRLNLWDGRSAPKLFVERVPFSKRGELPVKEISARLEAVLEKILRLAQQRPSLPPSDSARHEIAESLVKASATFAGRDYHYFPGQKEDKRFSQILRLLDTACFFEPQNAIAQIKRLNHRYGFWMEFSFNLKNPFWAKWKKSEAWGRFVEQFGLKTVAPLAFPYQDVSDVYVQSLGDVLNSWEAFYGVPADLPSEVETEWRRRANAEYEKRKAVVAEFVKTNPSTAPPKRPVPLSATTAQAAQKENSSQWQSRIKPMFNVPRINALPAERQPAIESISFPRNFDVTAVQQLVVGNTNLWIAATGGKFQNDPNLNSSLAEDLAVKRTRLWTCGFNEKQARIFSIPDVYQTSAILFHEDKLWIAGDGIGVFDFDTHAFKRFTLSDGFPLQYSEGIAAVDQKIFAAGDKFKIYQHDLRTPGWSSLPIDLRSRSFSGGTGSSMRLAACNRWLLFVAGTAVLYNTTDEKWSHLEGVDQITCVVTDKVGFWLGGNNGFYFADPETGKIQSWTPAPYRHNFWFNNSFINQMQQMPRRNAANDSNSVVALFARIARERSSSATRISNGVPAISRLPGGVSALASDGEFLWVASNNETGSYVLVFHKPSQKWVGCFRTESDIISMAVSEKYLWFGMRSFPGEKILARIDKRDLLGIPKSLWVPNAISSSEIQQLKARLPVRAQAVYAFFEGDYASVTRLLEADHVTDLEGLFLLAYSYDPSGLNDAAKSEKYFRRIIRQEPDSPFAKIASDAITANALPARERKLSEESLKRFDVNKNGILDEPEHLAMSRDANYINGKTSIVEMEIVQNCKEMIRRLDSDADGKLDIAELNSLWLKLSVYAVATPDQLRGRRIPFLPLLPLRELRVQNVLKQFDTNRDGKIDFSELKEMTKEARQRSHTKTD